MVMLILPEENGKIAPTLLISIISGSTQAGMEKLFTATGAFSKGFRWDVREVQAILSLTGRVLTAHFHC